MSNQTTIIEERARDIGDFLVGRLLPFRKKRMVGPFIFIDHMGPSVVKDNFDIGPHPHIGLSTLTYLFEGEIMHRDSLGTQQRITPGGVNWMTAGKGIVHSERIPDNLRGQSYNIHGYQIWVALPKELEDIEPNFYHAEAEELPTWHQQGLDFTLVAGKAMGKSSPVPVYSDLYMLNVKVLEDTSWSPQELYGETAICLVDGEMTACGETINQGNLLVAKQGEPCTIHVKKGNQLLIFGGIPFLEQRFIWWNFVSAHQEKIEKARNHWRSDHFPKIPGENGRIALPT